LARFAEDLEVAHALNAGDVGDVGAVDIHIDLVVGLVADANTADAEVAGRRHHVR